MTIAADRLPHPSGWDQRTGPVRSRSNLDGRMVFGRTADPALVERVLTLSWDSVRREVVDAIWRHYKAWAFGTFLLKDPRSGSDVRCRWLGPPTIQWTNPITASVVGDFEATLAHQ